MPVGSPVYRDALGFFRLASAGDAARYPAVGVVAVTSHQNRTVGVISSGVLTPNNWTAATGTKLLTLGAHYYLAVAPGKLTLNAAEAGALTHQAIGLATSTLTMQIFGNISLTPSSGLTMSIDVDEYGTGNYWTLGFSNGLLATATYTITTITSIILDDGAGNLFEVIVDPSGNLGTNPSAGPATADVILADGSGGFWKMIVDSDGNLGTTTDAGPATPVPELDDGAGGTWSPIVDGSGNLGAETVLA